MLFSDENQKSTRDKLIKLVEAAAYCLTVLGEKTIVKDRQIESAHNELYTAMEGVVDGPTAYHSEYHYILYRAKLKLKMHHFNG